ncbi:PREDICTED: protein SPA, chloroplastic-like [Theobroma cacao]|uniref:Protein SPA, chloroplastic-like n=1 Tax=Theobroma cacao TaxID=3641 RepID=A0AB32WTF0_THECC|nr:PREDICTED: protein SPA, chloroplastic-like [Theobroma cacao]
MSITLLLPHFHSPYLCSPLKPSTPSLSFKCGRSPRSPASYPCIRAVDLDQTTIVTASVGLISVAVGISIPIFCKSQIDSAAKRENAQP